MRTHTRYMNTTLRIRTHEYMTHGFAFIIVTIRFEPQVMKHNAHFVRP